MAADRASREVGEVVKSGVMLRLLTFGCGQSTDRYARHRGDAIRGKESAQQQEGR